MEITKSDDIAKCNIKYAAQIWNHEGVDPGKAWITMAFILFKLKRAFSSLMFQWESRVPLPHPTPGPSEYFSLFDFLLEVVSCSFPFSRLWPPLVTKSQALRRWLPDLAFLRVKYHKHSESHLNSGDEATSVQALPSALPLTNLVSEAWVWEWALLPKHLLNQHFIPKAC